MPKLGPTKDYGRWTEGQDQRGIDLDNGQGDDELFRQHVGGTVDLDKFSYSHT
jgi:hypothetical protein